MKKILPILFFISMLAGSCVSDLNFSPDLELKYPGQWRAPLVNTRLNLGDLVEKDSLAYADADGLVHILYREDSLHTQDVSEFIKIPQQDPFDVDVVVGTPNANVQTNLGTLGGAKLKNATIESGMLHWTAENNSPHLVEIEANIDHTDLNGQPFSFTIQAQPNTTSTGQINLNGLHFDFTQGTPAYNNLSVSLDITSTTAPNGTTVPISLKLENIIPLQATGYFGQRKINIPSGRLKTDLGILSNFAEGLYLSNPKIKILTKSNIGLPIEIAPEMLGVSSQSKVVALQLDSIDFAGSPTQGVDVIDSIIIDKNNSQIDDFIANVPTEILYSGDLTLNPDGETGTDNFITNDAYLQMGLEVDLPLELSSENVAIEQTFYNIDFGVEEEDYEFLEKLTLGFRVENGFPLDADMHVYFQDSTGTIIDSTEIALFDAAQVDANGHVTTPASGDRFYSFANSELNDIMRADDIRVRIVLNTTNGQVVRMLTEYYIDLILAAEVKLNYEL